MPVTQYKRFEKEMTKRITARAGRNWVFLRELVKLGLRQGKQRLTVLVLPHSEKNAYQCQISLFSLIFFAASLGIVLFGFAFLAVRFESSHAKMTRLTRELQSKGTALQNLRDEISRLRKPRRLLKAQMTAILAAVGGSSPASIEGAPAMTVVAGQAMPQGRFDELSELKSTTSLLERSAAPLDQISALLAMFRGLFRDTPTLWPLKGAPGVVTTRFGWTTNPFTFEGYFHTGIDIAWSQGTPIVAAADGTVSQVGYNDQLGNFVVVSHKYGFSTRYSHLVGFATRKGAKVARGDVIGYLGNTGLSTGPHVDYVVRLGSAYLNPMNFLSIEPNFSRVKAGTASD